MYNLHFKISGSLLSQEPTVLIDKYLSPHT